MPGVVMPYIRIVATLLVFLHGARAQAADINVAVAANFTEAAKEIGAAWEKTGDHKAVLSFGATGQFYTQISQGAPFDVFLSADQATVTKAVTDGLAVAGTQFTYAVGKLVLYSKDKSLVTGENTLKAATFEKLAIANPDVAPYGAAAVEVMKALGVYDALMSKLVQGQNIAQTYQFVDTGNAALGFVALSQVIGQTDGSRWVVPAKLYAPIKQDAALLMRAEANAAAKGFLAFLKGKEAAQIKTKFGYE